MTRFTATQKTPNQAPGGARTGRVRNEHRASTAGHSAQKVNFPGTSGASHAGGRGSVRRSMEEDFGSSAKNGATVARRGAGQSARLSFPTRSHGVAGGRVPGGFRFPSDLRCD
jgi:hypothetical protein